MAPGKSQKVLLDLSRSQMVALHLFYVLELLTDFLGIKETREERGFCYLKIFLNYCFYTKTLYLVENFMHQSKLVGKVFQEQVMITIC